MTVLAATLTASTFLAHAETVEAPWLKTSGNRIVVASTGQEVTLRGVNVLRSEWDLNMFAERTGIPILAKEWKGNVIVRGFASDPVLKDDSQYLEMLDEHVSLAVANNVYVIFAWRSYGINGGQPNMPDDQAQQALVKLAQRYRGKPNVMYALQVEPHNVTWAQVQPRYVQMVDAIQAASSPYKPIIMVPGVDWSRDVSGAIANPVRRENIVYKSHPYNSQSQFQHLFLDAYSAGLPVFLGEFGYAPDLNMNMTDINALLAVARQRNIGWAAWCFDYQGGPALVTNNSTFSPTSPYGVAIKNEMTSTPALPGGGGIGGDTTPPTVSIISPTSGSAVSGSVPITASADDNVGVSRVEFHVDGVLRGTSTAKPFQFTWDSAGDAAGTHSLTAEAIDTAGNIGASASVQVTVTGTASGANANDSAFRYTGTWQTSSGVAKFQGDDHYSDVVGSSYQMAFTGTQVRLYAATAPWHGKAAVSIDGGPETMVDFYSPSRADQALVYTSPTLNAGPHTVTVRVTGTRNASSTGTVVTADRAVVSASTAPTPTPSASVSSTSAAINDNTTGSGANQFQYTGVWSSAAGDPLKYQGDDHYSNVSGSVARIGVTGTRIVLYGAKAPWHGIAAVSIDGGTPTMVDYYASTRQDGVAVYTSPPLTRGGHVLTVSVSGTRSAASTDTVVTVDQVSVVG
jgi:hypothetical protein